MVHIGFSPVAKDPHHVDLEQRNGECSVEEQINFCKYLPFWFGEGKNWFIFLCLSGVLETRSGAAWVYLHDPSETQKVNTLIFIISEIDVLVVLKYTFPSSGYEGANPKREIPTLYIRRHGCRHWGGRDRDAESGSHTTRWGYWLWCLNKVFFNTFA